MCPKVPSTGSVWVVEEKQGLKRTEPEAHLWERRSNYNRQFSLRSALIFQDSVPLEKYQGRG